jgi:hypothetical protein
MVGRIPQEFSANDDEEWFPSDLVTLLGLATGRSIGVPFVELRGSSGELVARMHARIGSPSRLRRRTLIDEQFDRSTGALVTAFLASVHRNQAWLRVALRHLLSALTGDGTVEDRLANLFRIVEGLSGGLGLDAARPLELTTDTREKVLEKLGESSDALDKIASLAVPQDRERIWRLKSRLKEIEANRPSFPTQLVDLVERAELPDAEWLRNFRFRAKLKGQPTAWPSAAGAYRNRIFHSAFIDFEKFDIDNAVPFIDHLSDVLVRVIFHLIGFEGQYKPPCGAYGSTTHDTPSWPERENLSAELFRYVE